MISMAQSTANWRNTFTPKWIACIHSHTYINTVTTQLHQHSYINTVTTTLCEAASSAVAEFGIDFLFCRYLREGDPGANWSTRRKPPIACPLIGITY